MKKPICKILRTNKNSNYEFTIILGFLGIDLFKSLLMYSEGPICLSRLLFIMGGVRLVVVQSRVVK